MRILDGIKVLDLGRFIAGPYCAALLADLGADVIRIERPGGAEDRNIPSITPSREGGMYLQVNRNKRGMTLNIAVPDGRVVLEKMLRSADVVVANFSPAVLRSLKLDIDTLHRLNPRLILATATAFGNPGPYAERLGFDSVGQAMTGAAHISGDPDAPRRALVTYVDFSTATNCAMGVLAALMARDRTGKGTLVEGSLLKSGLVNTNGLLMEQALKTANRQPLGNRGYLGAPIDVFKVRDGFITVQVVGQPMFKRWCELMGEMAWLDDPQFASDELRGRHGAQISARMQCWCEQYSRDEALTLLNDAKLPAAPVYSAQEALNDEHIVQSGMFEHIAFPDTEGIPIVGHPVSIDGVETNIYRRPPLLGEHNSEILMELGYEDSEIRMLLEAAVI